MKRVREDGQWTLFSPDEAPDLTETFGKKFAEGKKKMEESGKVNLSQEVFLKMLKR